MLCAQLCGSWAAVPQISPNTGTDDFSKVHFNHYFFVPKLFTETRWEHVKTVHVPSLSPADLRVQSWRHSGEPGEESATSYLRFLPISSGLWHMLPKPSLKQQRIWSSTLLSNLWTLSLSTMYILPLYGNILRDGGRYLLRRPLYSWHQQCNQKHFLGVLITLESSSLSLQEGTSEVKDTQGL